MGSANKIAPGVSTSILRAEHKSGFKNFQVFGGLKALKIVFLAIFEKL